MWSKEQSVSDDGNISTPEGQDDARERDLGHLRQISKTIIKHPINRLTLQLQTSLVHKPLSP